MKLFSKAKKVTSCMVLSAFLAQSVSLSLTDLFSTTVANAVPRTHQVNISKYELLRQIVFDQNGVMLPNFFLHDKVTEKFENSFELSTCQAEKYLTRNGAWLLPKAEKYFRSVADKIFSRKCIAQDKNILLPFSIYVFGLPNEVKSMSFLNNKRKTVRYKENTAAFYNRFRQFDDKTKKDFLLFLDACDEIYEAEKDILFDKNPELKKSYDQAKEEINQNINKLTYKSCAPFHNSYFTNSDSNGILCEKSEYEVLEEHANKLGIEKTFYETMEYTNKISLSFQNISDIPFEPNGNPKTADTNCSYRLKVVFSNTLAVIEEAMKKIYRVPKLDVVNNYLNKVSTVYTKLIDTANEEICAPSVKNTFLSPEVITEKMFLLAESGASRSPLSFRGSLEFFSDETKVVNLYRDWAKTIFYLERIYDIAKPVYEADGITSFEGLGQDGAIAKFSKKDIDFSTLCGVLGITNKIAVKQELIKEINDESKEKVFEFSDLFGLGVAKSEILDFINGKINMTYRDIVLSTDKIGNIILFLLGKSKLHYNKNDKPIKHKPASYKKPANAEELANPMEHAYGVEPANAEEHVNAQEPVNAEYFSQTNPKPINVDSYFSTINSKSTDEEISKSNKCLSAVFILLELYHSGLIVLDGKVWDCPANKLLNEEVEHQANFVALRQRQARKPRKPEYEQILFVLPESVKSIIKDINQTIERIGDPEVNESYPKTFKGLKEVLDWKTSRISLPLVSLTVSFRNKGKNKLPPLEVSELISKKNWTIDLYNKLRQHIRETEYGLNPGSNAKPSIMGVPTEFYIVNEIRKDLKSIERCLDNLKDIS